MCLKLLYIDSTPKGEGNKSYFDVQKFCHPCILIHQAFITFNHLIITLKILNENEIGVAGGISRLWFSIVCVFERDNLQSVPIIVISGNFIGGRGFSLML